MNTVKHECEAVVVGTGAGGAVSGTMLAEAGVDTIFLEEGKYYKKEDHKDIFSGFVNMYLSSGATVTIGSPPISLTLGSTVGGTTAINSSTCFRPPLKKVESWGGPGWDELLPYIEEVEKRINAQILDEDLLGGNWTVLKRGCDKLGIDIKPLTHNVKNCKKRGRCQFGCPEGAKQSTEVSFIPGALDSGARLLTEHHVDGIIMESGKPTGLVGTCPEGRFEVRARHVILAMGAMRTPVFLQRHKLANSSRRVGKGLQIHPACRVIAEFDEIIDGHKGLPQGAFIDKWADRGVMLEGIFLPPGLLMPMMPYVGSRLKEIASSYRNLSAFGIMVSDTSSGTVKPGHFGSNFLALYQMNNADAESLKFGIARVCEIYLAAGAKKIYTGFYPVNEVVNEGDLKELENAPVKPRDLEIGAFHPVGTARMGGDSRKSVVDFSLQTHDIPGLYVMDASVIPASLGVNPQVTIMTLCMRAGRILADKIIKER